MADKKAEAPAGTGAEENEKKGKLAAAFASLGQLLGIGEAQPVASASTAAAPPAGLTAEQVRQEIASARAEDAVDADLKALASTIPPAVLSNARTRASLVAAKLEGPEAYSHQLGLVQAAGEGASFLLGGAVADAASTGATRTGLSVNATDQAWLEAHGCDAKQLAAIESKFGPVGTPRISVSTIAPQGN